MNHYFFYYFMLCFFLAGCKKEEVIEPANVNLEPSDSPVNLQGIAATFIKNIPYDVYEETRFDIWMPTSSIPTGLALYIHGGGFTSGDKDILYSVGRWNHPAEVRHLLANNIAVATINYRLLSKSNEQEGVLKPLMDSKRALQYIRHKSEVFNLDKEKIVLCGNSAGAGTSLWLATHDEMQDTLSTDSVLHESTRVKATALRETQASYDLENRWIDDVFVDYGTKWEDMLAISEASILRFYGVPSIADYEIPSIDAYRTEIDMLNWLTSDDPEIWAENILTDVSPPTSSNIANHHAFHVREIKRIADSVGVSNVCYYGKSPVIYSDPSGESFVNFIVRKINN